MGYKNYKIEDFLADEDFKRWVLTPNSKSSQFWESLSNGDASLQEKMRTARQLILHLDFHYDEPSEEDYQAVLKNVLNQSRIQSGQAIPTEETTRWRWVGIAASLVLALVLAILLSDSQQTVQREPVAQMIEKQNPKGQRSQIFLPDGSRVWLHADSRISYPEKFSDTIRLISLEGEGFFEVKKDSKRPFTVISSGLSTVALGTSFNVRSYPGEASRVSLVSGKVLVSDLANRLSSIELQPGETAQLDKKSGQLVQGRFDYEKEISWINGVIVFEEASFAEVREKLIRWYGVEIEVKGRVPSSKITGKFNNQSLANVLNSIGYSTDFEYNIEETKVYIRFK